MSIKSIIAFISLAFLIYSDADDSLEGCPHSIEVQFYDVAIEISPLPDACSEQDLISIGFLIQDVILEVEHRMPEYKEEYMTTDVCAKPEAVGREEDPLADVRHLETTVEKKKQRKKRGRYRWSKGRGRCKRCKKNNKDRLLRESEVCANADSAKQQKDRVATDLAETTKILSGIDAKARILDNGEADDILKEAQDTLDECMKANEAVTQAAIRAKRLCRKASKLRPTSKKMKKYERRSLGLLKLASNAVKTANSRIDQIRKYQRDMNLLYASFLESPYPSPTPSSIPTTSPSQSSSDRPSHAPSYESLIEPASISVKDEYIDRLSSNLESSNTGCEQVKKAMVQKTLAEEAVLVADEIYDEVLELALLYPDNADVILIKEKATAAHSKVKQEGAAAAAAAELASHFCDQVQRRLEESDFESLVQEETSAATEATLLARVALSGEKQARDEMEELVSLIEFDPVLSEIEGTTEEDEAVLKDHLAAVEAEILEVDSQIKALPKAAPATKVAALDNKLESLMEEENQIEEALVNEEQFRLSQSALVKDEFYESVAPDFVATPPLEYVLRSSLSGTNLTVEINWDPLDEVSGSKEEWFRRYGDMIVVDIPKRLFKAYNTTTGGCIEEDSDLIVVVLLNELETVWESSDPLQCSLDLLEDVVASKTPSNQQSWMPSTEPSSPPSFSTAPSAKPSSLSVPSTTPTEARSAAPNNSPSNQPSSDQKED